MVDAVDAEEAIGQIPEEELVPGTQETGQESDPLSLWFFFSEAATRVLSPLARLD